MYHMLLCGDAISFFTFFPGGKDALEDLAPEGAILVP